MENKSELYGKRKGGFVSKALAVLLLIVFLSVSFTVSDYFILAFVDPDIDVNLFVVIPWFCLISLVTASFLNCFNFGGRRYHDMLYSAYATALLSSMILLALPYVAIGAQVSKKVVLLNFVLLIILLPIWLSIARRIYFRLRPPLATVLITDDSEEHWIADVITRYSAKYDIKRIISPDDPDLEEAINASAAVAIGRLGTIDKEALLALCASLGKKLLIRPEYTDILMGTSHVEQFDDLMMISVNMFSLSSGQRLAKRILDLTFGIIALVPALPITLVCALIILLSDGHNPFYTQTRLTAGGRPYKLYKLRTMKPDAEAELGPVLAEKDDPRITRVGRFLRSCRLDEIPQVFNILKGDMSVVGPRPERPYFYDQYDQSLPEFRLRLSVKAGLTGMAQVQGRYSSDPYEKLMLDLMYIKSYSVMLDIKLIIETLHILFVRESSEGFDSSDSSRREK